MSDIKKQNKQKQVKAIKKNWNNYLAIIIVVVQKHLVYNNKKQPPEKTTQQIIIKVKYSNIPKVLGCTIESKTEVYVK